MANNPRSNDNVLLQLIGNICLAMGRAKSLPLFDPGVLKEILTLDRYLLKQKLAIVMRFIFDPQRQLRILYYNIVNAH